MCGVRVWCVCGVCVGLYVCVCKCGVGDVWCVVCVCMCGVGDVWCVVCVCMCGVCDVWCGVVCVCVCVCVVVLIPRLVMSHCLLTGRLRPLWKKPGLSSLLHRHLTAGSTQ